MNSVPLTVVGIGASAGGIEAFHRFFEKMPPDSGLGFIVVLHLAPDRKSMLPAILARWTAMPVSEAHDGDAVVANHVLVIPPGTVGALHDGCLSLHQSLPGARREIAPIDMLFDTMAQSLNEDAIGIILSGTGRDGALGLKAIKARGGLTLAQGVNGTAPEYSGMPGNAVAAGGVDLFVAVEQMPALIIAAHEVRLASLRGAAQSTVDFDSIRMVLCEILQSRLGHDFSQYKRQTFIRRVQRRMQVLRMAHYDAYIARLRADREQVVLLFRDLLISVTSFFRDSPTFAVLEKTIVPSLFQDKNASSDLRIWVPGCATGEEAYSLAILLLEHMDTLPFVPKVQIFASDIDEGAIATARAGHYPATLLDGLSSERRARFFVEGTGGYAVQQRVRALCTFSAHSLIRDPPFSRIDLISCRNLLIYLDGDLQDRVTPIFHYALVPGGTLVLGASETIGRHDRLFRPIDRSKRIFIRLTGPSDVPDVYPVAERAVRQGMGKGVVRHTDPRTHWLKAVAVANRRALENFAPPFVVVGRDGEVVHFSGHTGRFLEPAHGSPSTNLFELARRGWGLELRSALQRCIETGLPVEQRRIIVAADDVAAAPVRLIVEPLSRSDADQLYMIVFDEAGPPNWPGDASQIAAVPETDEAIARVERENRDLRDQLRSIVEERATSVEELRSSNEELQSVNEELQSTNEELETSREEIQSINEELHTVNAQLAANLEQLDRTNSDLRNLFDSTQVATIFLDQYMVIRSFTPEIACIYNLIPSDVGRPLTDIVSRLSYASLQDDVRTVMRSLEPMERRVQREDRTAHYLMRILPYRSPDSSIDGSLITFVDVTSIVRAEEHQRLLVDELNHRVKNMLTAVISLATNTLRRAETLEGFQDVFMGRIHAFTAAYALLSRDGWSPIPLRAILAEELQPFIASERVNVSLSGPAVVLEPRAALAMELAVHELTTNAVKYGALSVAEGNVEVRWTVETKTGARWLVLQWIERNGPSVAVPGHRGFGMTLIERVFAHDVGGEAKVDFQPEGVVATLQAPLPGKTLKGPL